MISTPKCLALLCSLMVAGCDAGAGNPIYSDSLASVSRGVTQQPTGTQAGVGAGLGTGNQIVAPANPGSSGGQSNPSASPNPLPSSIPLTTSSPLTTLNPLPADNPLTTANPLVANNAGGLISGLILDQFGQPAAGVSVKAFLNASLVANNASAYRTASVGVHVTTDNNGRFQVSGLSVGSFYNISAVQSDSYKAWLSGVKAASAADSATPAPSNQAVLGPTHQIKGSVFEPGVTDYSFVEVWIPGSDTEVHADPSGHFVVKNLAMGHYDGLNALDQSNPSAKYAATSLDVSGDIDLGTLQLGKTEPQLAGVAAIPGPQGVTADVVSRAVLTASPFVVFPGSWLLLTGTNLGYETNLTPDIRFNNATVPKNSEGQQDSYVQGSIAGQDYLAVKVPASAQSGDLVVLVGGQQSNRLPFTAVTDIKIDQMLKPGDNHPRDSSFLNVDGISGAIALGQSLTLMPSGIDDKKNPEGLPDGAAQWQILSGGAYIGLTRDHNSATITAKALPVDSNTSVAVEVQVGSIAKIVQINLFKITGITLTNYGTQLSQNQSLTIALGPAIAGGGVGATLGAQVVYAPGSASWISTGVTWTSDNPAVTIDRYLGGVVSLPANTATSATITAISLADPTASASVKLNITDFQNFSLEIN